MCILVCNVKLPLANQEYLTKLYKTLKINVISQEPVTGM